MKTYIKAIIFLNAFVLVSFFAAVKNVGAAPGVYYVDKDSIGGACSDSAAGTLITAPWCSIGKAASTLAAGDTVYIRAGTYYEQITPSNSGSPGSPVTYARYGGETVIIDGSTAITGWSQYSGNVYSASVTVTPNDKFTAAGYNCTNNYGGLVMQDGVKLNYCMATGIGGVDTVGKYFMNDSGGCSAGSPCTLYVYLRDIGSKGYNPDNYEMRVGVKRNGFDLNNGSDYLIFDGLEIRRSEDNGIHSIGATNITIRNCRFYGHHTTGVYLTAASDNTLIELNEFWDNDHAGIEYWGSSGGMIRRNRFKKVDLGNGYGGNGAHIYLGGLGSSGNWVSNTTVENNLAYDTSSNYGSAGGIQIRGNNNTVYHNTVYKSKLSGLALVEGANNTYKNNIVYNDGSENMGVIAVFAAAVAAGGNIFSNNDIYTLKATSAYYWNGTFYDTLAAWEAASGQSGNISSDPLFVDLANRDFHLTASSPAVNFGVNVGVTTDYAGATRPVDAEYDIGAYEYVSTTFDTTPPAAPTGIRVD